MEDNMKFKRILVVLLAIILVPAISACGKKEDKKTNDSTLSVAASDAGMPNEAPKNGDNAKLKEEINKLVAEENSIMAKDQKLWEKVFANAKKSSDPSAYDVNYADFLKSTIEASKDKFSADELKILNESVAKIEKLEAKIAELKKKAGVEEGPEDNNSQSQETTGLAVKDKFPEFKGKDLEGKDVDNSLFKKNAVTVINFWFSTCSPCVGELDELNALNKELKAKGGEVIGVNSFTLDNNAEAIAEAKKILKAKGAEYRNINFPSNSEAGKFVKNLMSYPTTIVVNRDGNIVGDPIMGAIAEGNQKQVLMDMIQKVIASDKK